MRKAILAAAAAVMAVVAAAQAAEQATPTGTANVIIEAGVMMQSGDLKRAARTEFRLLKADFGDFLVKRQTEKTSAETQILWFNVSRMMVSARLTEPGEIMTSTVAEGEAFLKKHTVATITTDFDGKATVNVPPGQYFVLGSFKVFKNTVVWNLPLELNAGSNRIILDHNNAL